MPSKNRSHSYGDGVLLLIAIFKFVKGALLLALAFGALTLLHKDVASEVEYWLDHLRIDPDNKLVGALLTKLQLAPTKELKGNKRIGRRLCRAVPPEAMGGAATIVATSSLMPIEVYELVKEFAGVRLLALLINAAVVLYLIYLVRQKEKGGSKNS